MRLHKHIAEPRHKGRVRGYDAPGAGFLPGVTSVLKATKPRRDREAIDRWADRVGADEAEAILVDASQRGRSLHRDVEDFFVDGNEGAGSWWASVAPFVRGLRPLLVEGFVWHPEGFAGAVDCVAELPGGVVAVVDWKTARRPKRREWIRDYELQVAAYCAAVNRVYGTRIKRGVVVVGLVDQPAQVFELDAAAMFSAWQEFRGRLEVFKAEQGVRHRGQ